MDAQVQGAAMDLNQWGADTTRQAPLDSVMVGLSMCLDAHSQVLDRLAVRLEQVRLPVPQPADTARAADDSRIGPQEAPLVMHLRQFEDQLKVLTERVLLIIDELAL